MKGFVSGVIISEILLIFVLVFNPVAYALMQLCTYEITYYFLNYFIRQSTSLLLIILLLSDE